MMKIAVPTVQGRLCTHFGHCAQFCFVEVDGQNRITGQQMLTPPPHEPGVLPKWLAENNVNVILAGGMGVRAQELLAQSGVKVVTGVQGNLTPEEAVTAYLNGTLQTGANACSH
jgi:predicted Fe-Mo cluster-binding NifX family protein